MENEILNIKAGNNISLEVSENKNITINAETSNDNSGFSYNESTNTSTSKGDIKTGNITGKSLETTGGITTNSLLKGKMFQLTSPLSEGNLNDSSTSIGVVKTYSSGITDLEKVSIDTLQNKINPNLQAYNKDINTSENITASKQITGGKLAVSSIPSKIDLATLPSTLLPVLVLNNGKYEVRYVDYATLFEYGKANFNWNVEGGDEYEIEDITNTGILVNASGCSGGCRVSGEPDSSQSSAKLEITTDNFGFKILCKYGKKATIELDFGNSLPNISDACWIRLANHKFYIATWFYIESYYTPTSSIPCRFSCTSYLTALKKSDNSIVTYSNKLTCGQEDSSGYAQAESIGLNNTVRFSAIYTESELYKLVANNKTFISFLINTRSHVSKNVFHLKCPILVDLTEAFGYGNEPTKDWCDQNIPYFKDTMAVPNFGGGDVVVKPPSLTGNGVATNLCFYSGTTGQIIPDTSTISAGTGSVIGEGRPSSGSSGQISYYQGANLCRSDVSGNVLKCLFKKITSSSPGTATLTWNFDGWSHDNYKAAYPFYIGLCLYKDTVPAGLTLDINATITLSNNQTKTISLASNVAMNSLTQYNYTHYSAIATNLTTDGNVSISKLTITVQLKSTSIASDNLIYLSDFALVNLSSTFGSGNEPSLDIANELLYLIYSVKNKIDIKNIHLFNRTRCAPVLSSSGYLNADSTLSQDNATSSPDYPVSNTDSSKMGSIAVRVKGTSGNTWFRMYNMCSIPAGHKIYIRVYYKVTRINGTNVKSSIEFYPYHNSGIGTRTTLLNSVASSTLTSWTLLSSIITNTKTMDGCAFVGLMSGTNGDYHNDTCTNYLISCPMIVDLTLTYGAGNEPTKEWLDSNLPYFLDEMEKI